MDSRERILAALNHQQPDRPPFDLGATVVSGIHWRAYQRLRDKLDLPQREHQIADVNQQLAWVEDDLLDLCGVDVRSASLRVSSNAEIRFGSEGEYETVFDSFGIGRRRPKDQGLYFDLYHHPLAGAVTVDDIKRFPWPDLVSPVRLEGIRERSKDIIERQRRAVVVGSVCAGLMEMHAFLRGYQDYYLDLGSDLPLAGAIMDRVLEMKLAYWEKMLALLGDQVDVVQEADDMAGQTGMLISPRTYRSLVKPRHKELFDFIHAHTNAKIFFHSCGAIRPVIPDLIEVGVDILNPIQSSASGMDPDGLKHDFGSELTFWGGGVDTQRVLGTGTPEQVRADVRRRVETLAPGGGFVFAAVHNIQSDVPSENIIAMLEALRE